MFHTLPLLEEARGESMTAPSKRGAQATLSCPQLTAILYELGEYIAWDALLVRELGWEECVK